MQTETILHETLLHGEAQAALINQCTIDGKIDYQKLQAAYKKHYPTNDPMGTDHEQLGKGSATLFNKGVLEVEQAIQSIPVMPTYYLAKVQASYDYKIKSDGSILTTTTYGKVLAPLTTFTMSQRFSHYVELDIQSHQITSAPTIGKTRTETPSFPQTGTEIKQVEAQSSGKRYVKPAIVQLP